VIVSKGTTKSLKLGTTVGIVVSAEIKEVGLVTAGNELVAVRGVFFAGVVEILPKYANGSFKWLEPPMGGAARFPRVLKGSFDWLFVVTGGADKLPRRPNGSSADWPLVTAGIPVGVPNTIISNDVI